jgi:sugar phosphate isomerase/epimerase
MPTRTGSFTIGFRRGGTNWQKDIKSLAGWAKTSGFEAVDLGKINADDAAVLRGEGLALGSVDLLDMGKISSADPAVRKQAVDSNIAYVKQAAELGARIFFTIIGGDAALKRSENYAHAVEGFSPLAAVVAELGGKIAIEGYPGGGNHPNLCCNPETYRSFIKDVNPRSVAVNYDPSHLLRMGIDHIRFLNEFAAHVVHVHGKDTEIMPEAAYELGLFQDSAFHKGHGWGANAWRYTLPGHGQTRWTEVTKILKAHNYNGAVSVELEDENFNGSEAGEKAGLLHSLAFLRGI